MILPRHARAEHEHVRCNGLLGGTDFASEGMDSRLNELKVRLGGLKVAPRFATRLNEVGRYWLEREDGNNRTRPLLVQAGDNSDGIVDNEAHQLCTSAREELIQDFVRNTHRVPPNGQAVQRRAGDLPSNYGTALANVILPRPMSARPEHVRCNGLLDGERSPRHLGRPKNST